MGPVGDFLEGGLKAYGHYPHTSHSSQLALNNHPCGWSYSAMAMRKLGKSTCRKSQGCRFGPE